MNVCDKCNDTGVIAATNGQPLDGVEPCPCEGFKKFEDFESDGHTADWTCPLCNTKNNQEIWEEMPENNGRRLLTTIYCSDCGVDFKLRAKIEYCVEFFDVEFKQVK